MYFKYYLLASQWLVSWNTRIKRGVQSGLISPFASLVDYLVKKSFNFAHSGKTYYYILAPIIGLDLNRSNSSTCSHAPFHIKWPLHYQIIFKPLNKRSPTVMGKILRLCCGKLHVKACDRFGFGTWIMTHGKVWKQHNTLFKSTKIN